jgi:AraC-like DNA-binding protein
MRNAPHYQPALTGRKRTRSEVDEFQKERAAWFGAAAPDSLLHPLLAEVPGLTYWAKDRQGRFMVASRQILRRYGIQSESDLLGLTDHDITPKAIADGYVQADRLVMTGGVERVERLELAFDSQGTLDWFLVTKLPMRDQRGRIIGTMGLMRRAGDHASSLPLVQSVSKAVELIRSEYAKGVTMSEVAQRSGQSLRQLQRCFQNAFGISPQEFLIKTRVLAAMTQLDETGHTAAEIASKCGFVDPSSFAKQFKQRTGVTPRAYRQRAQGVSTSQEACLLARQPSCPPVSGSDREPHRLRPSAVY